MPEKRRAMLICLLLAAGTLALYWPVTHFDFINLDDPEYVIYNSPIQHGVSGHELIWSFATRHASNWHPLTWTSHALDFALFGLNPAGHHLTNLLFHTANVVLLFLVLLQFTGAMWRSALVAALFAWHPLHVESVAWISERKDVLSAFFLFLTLAAYGLSVRAAGAWRKAGYGLALAFFALGLLSKPMLVTLPFALLLLDFWPLQRKAARGMFLEKIPFLILAAFDGAATVWAQTGAHSVISFKILPVSARLANALISCVLYLWKTIWPVELALPYPYHLWTFWAAAGAAIVLLGISTAAILLAKRRPYLIVGWLWFLITIAPVIGLTQTGIQSMADRYTYAPLIGIFIMAAWVLPGAWACWPRPGFVFGAAVAGALLFLMAATEVQLQYWRDSIALFSHTVAVTGNNIMAEYNLAEALARHGDEAQAIEHYQKALAIEPNLVEAHYNSQTQAHYNLGLIYRQHKQWAPAEAQFRAFVQDDPGKARGHSNLGIALVALGRIDQAQAEFQTAARLDPTRAGPAQLLTTLGAAYAEAGHFDQAIATARQARSAALAAGRNDLAREIEKSIDRYRAGSP